MQFTSLFDILALVYGFIAVRTAIALGRKWKNFWRGPLDGPNRKLAYEIGFFLILPFGVLLHEFGHTLATWQLGGRVVQFSWRGFWGFIVPAGNFTAQGHWWISLSGNVVSVAVGLALLAAGYFSTGLLPSVRYVLLQAGYVQTWFALIVYPVMGLVGFGDWVTVYNFRATPALSAATAAAHAGLLAVLLKYKREGRLESKLWGLASGREDEVTGLEEAIRLEPDAPGPRLALAEYHMGQGSYSLAEQVSAAAVKRFKDRPELFYALGKAIAAQGRSNDAVEPFKRGVQVSEAGSDMQQSLRANLAISLVAAGRSKEALAVFEELAGPLRDDWTVKRWHKRALEAEAG